MTEAVVAQRITVETDGFVNPINLAANAEAASHVKVYGDNVLLQIGVDYTLDGVGDTGDLDAIAGVEVTIDDAVILADEYDTFTVEHDPPLDQETDISAGGTLGRIYETGLDAAAMTAKLIVSGAFTADDGADAVSMSGQVFDDIFGELDATDEADIAALAGVVQNRGGPAVGGFALLWGGAGGGGGGTGSGVAGGAGGFSPFGGGGGGGGAGVSSGGAGGVSMFGGNGGAGSTASTAATAGSAPGGGGGGSEQGNSGAGGNGRVEVYVF